MTLELSDARFTDLSRYVQDHYGIQLPPEKKVLVHSRLSRRARELGFRTVDAYIAGLFAPGGDPVLRGREFSRMADLLSTHMTSFFREKSHFDFLVDRILPELAGDRRFDSRDPFLVWSAACSTGEEAWTLAFCLETYQARRPRGSPAFEWAVLGTDLSQGVLETARKGIYPAEVLGAEGMGGHRGRFLRARVSGDHRVRVVPEVRRRVFFRPLNLMDQPYEIAPRPQVIFCRNVLIYFPREVQHRVLLGLEACLAPGGYLVLGHAESVVHLDFSLVQQAPTVYQKPWTEER